MLQLLDIYCGSRLFVCIRLCYKDISKNPNFFFFFSRQSLAVQFVHETASYSLMELSKDLFYISAARNTCISKHFFLINPLCACTVRVTVIGLCLCVCVCVCVCLSVSVCLSVCLCVCLCVCLSFCLMPYFFNTVSLHVGRYHHVAMACKML